MPLSKTLYLVLVQPGKFPNMIEKLLTWCKVSTQTKICLVNFENALWNCNDLLVYKCLFWLDFICRELPCSVYQTRWINPVVFKVLLKDKILVEIPILIQLNPLSNEHIFMFKSEIHILFEHGFEFENTINESWVICMNRKRSGSMVECLTRDRRAAGSSLTGVTALWSLSKTHLS